MNNRQTLRATVTTSVRRLHKTRSTFEADASRAQSSQSATRRDIHQQEPTLETTTKSGKLSNLGAIISAATRRVSRLRDTGTRDCRARVIMHHHQGRHRVGQAPAVDRPVTSAAACRPGISETPYLRWSLGKARVSGAPSPGRPSRRGTVRGTLFPGRPSSTPAVRRNWRRSPD